jgi:hypothetical protein
MVTLRGVRVAPINRREPLEMQFPLQIVTLRQLGESYRRPIACASTGITNVMLSIRSKRDALLMCASNLTEEIFHETHGARIAGVLAIKCKTVKCLREFQRNVAGHRRKTIFFVCRPCITIHSRFDRS